MLTRRIIAAALLCLPLGLAGCNPQQPPPGEDVDTDADGINDADEGNGDTDGDGIPDAEDPDSDGDGILDADEAGDGDPNTPPLDSDNDGTPDFQDIDADNNGLNDVDELDADTDGDGRPDRIDVDDDGDGLLDAQELAGVAPDTDTDLDGIPDLRDTDSDNDGLVDGAETAFDTDNDGIKNFRDQDSDNDTFSDSVEGTNDIDGDGLGNFIDRDSDSDGLPDAQEAAAGTNPTNQDTDGDGFTDLVEQVILEQCQADPANCNGAPDPLNPAVGVSDDDFVFVLPFQGPPQQKPLDFGTNIQAADIHFSVDTTGSMNEEINNLKGGLATIINNVTNPDPTVGIPNTAFGVSRFEDFPIAPYGNANAGDRPFQLHQRISTSIQEAQAGVNALAVRNGADLPESGFEALFQIATGAGAGAFVAPFNAAAGFDPAKNGTIGGVGFREDSLPIIVQVTDIISHVTGPARPITCFFNGFGIGTIPSAYGEVSAQFPQFNGPVIAEAHSQQQAFDALQGIGARVIGIASNEFDPNNAQTLPCNGRSDLVPTAQATGAQVPPEAFTDPVTGVRPAGCAANQCCTGVNGTGRGTDANGLCSLVFDVNANGTGEFASLIVTAIRTLTQFAIFDISTLKKNNTPQFDANNQLVDPLAFIKSITPRTDGLFPPPAGGIQIDAALGAFLNVQPGTVATFDVEAVNDFLQQAIDTQVFTLQIDVRADNITTLDTRQVVIIVPPLILDEEG